MRSAVLHRSLSTGALLAGVLVAALALPTRAVAADVATVSAVEGTAERGRAEDWQALEVGAGVLLGDQVRTGVPGAASLLFVDDSVVTVGEGTTLGIDRQLFDPDAGTAETALNLFTGKVRSVVSDYYKSPGSSFEVTTRTAVMGVRGTDFVVAFDAGSERTTVLCLAGRTEVCARDVPGDEACIVLGPMEVSRIDPGVGPTTPLPATGTVKQGMTSGVSFVGGGETQSLSNSDPLLDGSAVAPPDRATQRRDAPDNREPRGRSREEPSVDPRSIVEAPIQVIGDGGLEVEF